MVIDVEELAAFHVQINEHLQEFAEHKDHASRLTILKKGKRLVAKYFKASIALNNFLHTAKISTEHLESTLRRYGGNMNSEAKKIMGLYIEYGHGYEHKNRFKFQMELAEVIVLLEHRVKNERQHLIPEYKITQNNAK